MCYPFSHLIFQITQQQIRILNMYNARITDIVPFVSQIMMA